MFFVLDENKNLIEGYDKEGVLALLEQAIEDGDLSGIESDSAFVSKLKSLVNGTTHHIEFVTQAQYNQLENDGDLVPNTYYFITDDDTAEDLENAVNNILNGTTTVPNAANAGTANNALKVNNLAITRDENGVLKIGDIVIPQKKLLWSGKEYATQAEAFIFNAGNNLSLGDRILVKVSHSISGEGLIGFYEVTLDEMLHATYGTINCSSSSITVESNGSYPLKTLWVYGAKADNDIYIYFYAVKEHENYARAAVYIREIYKIIE